MVVVTEHTVDRFPLMSLPLVAEFLLASTVLFCPIE
jgi:hypothetical protein